MLVSSIPPKFPIPFASAAGPAFIRPIPVESQIGIQDGAASLTDGFVPDNFTPIVAGGVPPFGQDMNGILKQSTLWLRWLQAGGPIQYDADFAAAIGGYPKGTLLTTIFWCPGTRWLSLVDNNLVDPDTDGTGWTQDPNQVQIGTPTPFLVPDLPFGYIAANGGTVGNAASNGSLIASSTVLLFYASIWRNFSNSQCPVFNSSGVPVGRGANPTADFNANNQIAVPDLRGRGLTGIDLGGATGRLAGVPVVSGAVTVAGSVFGENLHLLILSELASHAHANSLIDPTHLHSIVDSGHTHASSLSDPGHLHSNTLSDPGHAHPINNVNHLNGWTNTVPGGSGFTTGAGTIREVNAPDLLIASAPTGVSINNTSHATGLSINNAGAVTGITDSSAATGMSISNAAAGGGGSHNNVPESMGVIWGLKL